MLNIDITQMGESDITELTRYSWRNQSENNEWIKDAGRYSADVQKSR
jgi:hypothetical protein